MTNTTKCTAAELEEIKDEVVYEATNIKLIRLTLIMALLVIMGGSAKMLHDFFELDPWTFMAGLGVMYLGIINHIITLPPFKLSQDNKKTLRMAAKITSERQARRVHCRKSLEAQFE